ncbi:hypothetical protein K505DRAFT_267328, partial [Melanomma pulvis-pyrius CBS 109.77]
MEYEQVRSRPDSEDNRKDHNEAQFAEPKRGFFHFLNEWSWEYFTWTLGSAAVASIVVLLLSFRDKPVSEWKSKVQITAIMAALAQTAQSALLVSAASCISQLKWIWFQKARPTYDIEIYDRASRGPEGCLQLLFRL